EEEALMRQLIDQFEQYMKIGRKNKQDPPAPVEDIDEPSHLTFIITSHLPIKVKEKQAILEIDNVKDRMQYLLTILYNAKKILNLEKKIVKSVQNYMEQTHIE